MTTNLSHSLRWLTNQLLSLLVGCILLASAPAFAGPPAAPMGTAVTPPTAEIKPLVVGTLAIPPFIIHNDDGTWSGISIDLFKRVADDMKVPYTIREAGGDDWIHPERSGIDVLVSLNIAARNEKNLDLTHAFFSTGLGIATRPEPKSGFTTILSKMLSTSFMKGVGIVAAALLVMGVVVWYIERHTKPEEFGGSAWRGIAHGVFWAFESIVGKAGALSKTRAARFVALLWTFTTMLLVSGVTAKLSAELTVNQLSTTVSGLNDLPKVKVGISKVSVTSKNYLQTRSIRTTIYDSAAKALEGLDRGEVDAVVDEAPILQYHVNKTYPGRILVLPGTFENHGYGFGLVLGSPLRKRFNISLLNIVEGQEWKSVISTYLGN